MNRQMEANLIDYLLSDEVKIQGVRVGWIVAIEDSGRVLVDFPDNPLGPVKARLTILADMETLRVTAVKKQQVLLVFENDDPGLPIIIGLLQEKPVETTSPVNVTVEAEEARDVLVDGKRVVFDAKEEIVLRCGKGNITLKKDGKIVIKGTHLLSRSSGPHRIKGARVDIN